MAAGTGLVFDVQRFSIHDGPGIRTTVFFKGCPLRCRWCQNPESQRVKPELMFYAERCQAEAGCVAACPSMAISIEAPGRVDRARCDACGLCESACAHEALRIVGREVTIESLWEEVSADQPFWKASGGGVTLSGGEATAQMAFATAFARRCKEAEATVGLQTCGAFGWADFEPLLAQLDFVMFDLKAGTDARHRQLTGGSYRAILANAQALLGAEVPVTLRTPIVPGANDDEDELRALAGVVHELGATTLHLLRYHAMGEAKVARLGEPAPAETPNGRAADEALARAQAILAAEDIVVVGPDSGPATEEAR